jgi:hypothetical protein
MAYLRLLLGTGIPVADSDWPYLGFPPSLPPVMWRWSLTSHIIKQTFRNLPKGPSPVHMQYSRPGTAHGCTAEPTCQLRIPSLRVNRGHAKRVFREGCYTWPCACKAVLLKKIILAEKPACNPQLQTAWKLCCYCSTAIDCPSQPCATHACIHTMRREAVTHPKSEPPAPPSTV